MIANPATHHLGVAMPLAEAGVHLLIGKPIVDSGRGVSAMIDTCRARGISPMTGYNLRFLPSLQRFRGLLGEAVVGRVLSVRAEIGQYLASWRGLQGHRVGASAPWRRRAARVKPRAGLSAMAVR